MRRRMLSESEISGDYIQRRVERQPVEDITINVMYQPRTITVLTILILLITFFAFNRPSNSSMEEDMFCGFVTVVFVFIIISAMIMPNGPFIRPHPLVWRIIFGASLLYFLCLVFALFLRLNDVRRILFYLYPDLRTMSHSDILDKEYAVNCSQVSLGRIWSYMDIFAVAHFFGWLVKAILLRHYWILWTLSINWEITELAFSHILPNFMECWWDSIVLDILLCNGLGIWCGMQLCHWLEIRNYHWESIRDIRSTRGKLKRLALQFTPNSWTPTQWLCRDSSVKRALQLSILIFFWQLTELNSFFLKHVFIVKPSHPLTQMRLALITLSSAPAIRQFYYYVTCDQVHRVGSQMWIFTATTLTETLVAFKLGSENFEKAILWNIVYWLIWLVVSSFLTVFGCLLLTQYKHPRQKASCQQNLQSSAPTAVQPDLSTPVTDDEEVVRRLSRR